MNSVIASGLLAKCPNCQQGDLFSNYWSLRETCDVCGARFLRDEGSWIAPTAFGYGFGAAVGVGGGVLLIATGTMFKGAEYMLMVIAGVATLVVYPWTKGMWVGMLHGWGLVYPDPVKVVEAPVAAVDESEEASAPKVDASDEAIHAVDSAVAEATGEPIA